MYPVTGTLFAAFVPLWPVSVPYGLLSMTTNARQSFEIENCVWRTPEEVQIDINH
jgi:hypothetical protein